MRIGGKAPARVLAATCSLSLGGCLHLADGLGIQNRIDPHTVAAYRGDQHRYEHRAHLDEIDCPLVRPTQDGYRSALNLDCFRFPEDSQTLGRFTTNPKGKPIPSNQVVGATIASTTVIAAPAGVRTAATHAGPGSVVTSVDAARDANTRAAGAAKPPASTETVTRTIRVDAAPTAYALASGPDPVARNRLASILIKLSDDQCTLELGRLEGKVDVFNGAAAVATTSFAGAATVITGKLAKTILSGMATVTSGAHDQVDAQVLHNQMVSAIVQAIGNNRAAMLATIQASYGKSTLEWSVDDAIRDVNQYHQICSFYRGMELVLEAVNKTAPAAAAPATATAASSALAELRVEYGKVATLAAMTTDKDQKKALMTEMAALQGKIDDALTPKPAGPAPAQVTLATSPAPPTGSGGGGSAAPSPGAGH